MYSQKDKNLALALTYHSWLVPEIPQGLECLAGLVHVTLGQVQLGHHQFGGQGLVRVGGCIILLKYRKR